jgi:hypothetical protein
MDDDHEEQILTVPGLSAYVDPTARPKTTRSDGASSSDAPAASPPLTPDQETDSFNRYAAEDREENRRARAER